MHSLRLMLQDRTAICPVENAAKGAARAASDALQTGGLILEVDLRDLCCRFARGESSDHL